MRLQFHVSQPEGTFDAYGSRLPLIDQHDLRRLNLGWNRERDSAFGPVCAGERGRGVLLERNLRLAAAVEDLPTQAGRRWNPIRPVAEPQIVAPARLERHDLVEQPRILGLLAVEVEPHSGGGIAVRGGDAASLWKTPVVSGIQWFNRK